MQNQAPSFNIYRSSIVLLVFVIAMIALQIAYIRAYKTAPLPVLAIFSAIGGGIFYISSLGRHKLLADYIQQTYPVRYQAASSGASRVAKSALRNQLVNYGDYHVNKAMSVLAEGQIDDDPYIASYLEVLHKKRIFSTIGLLFIVLSYLVLWVFHSH